MKPPPYSIEINWPSQITLGTPAEIGVTFTDLDEEPSVVASVDALITIMPQPDLFETDPQPIKTRATVVEARLSPVSREGRRWRFQGTIVVPEEAAYSYAGEQFTIEHEIRIRTRVPGGTTQRREASIAVVPPEQMRPPPTPTIVTLAVERGPVVLAGGPAVLDLAVASNRLAPGGTLAGAVALVDGGPLHVRAVELRLWVIQRIHTTETRLELELPVVAETRAGDALVASSFRTKLPTNLCCSFRVGDTELVYLLEARFELGGSIWSQRVVATVPIKISALYRFSGDVMPLAGMDRWRAEWSRAAAGHGLVLASMGLEVTGTVAGVNVRVGAETSRSGLVATLHWPPWGIDFLAHHHAAGGVRTGFARWIRHLLTALRSTGSNDDLLPGGTVHSRERAQAEAVFTEGFRSALLAFDEAQIDDDHASLTGTGAPHDEAAVATFLDRVARLAAELSAATSRLPPPAAMASCLPAFRAFANQTEGRLEIGSMSVLRFTDGQGVYDLHTRFEGASPKGIVLRLKIVPPLTADREVGHSSHWDVQVGELATAGRVKIQRSSIEIELAPVRDPAALRDVMRDLFEIVLRLRGSSTGPYR